MMSYQTFPKYFNTNLTRSITGRVLFYIILPMTPEAKEQLEELKRYCYSIGLTVKETAFYISVRPVGILYKVGGVLTKSKLENFTEKVKQHGSRTLK